MDVPVLFGAPKGTPYTKDSVNKRVLLLFFIIW
jgi:hypothetical protein